MAPVPSAAVDTVANTVTTNIREDTPEPLRPDYGGASLDGLVPGLMAPPGERPAWLPAPAR